jgi:hypothetical protein
LGSEEEMLRKILLLFAVLILLFAAFIWFIYSRDIGAARERVATGSKVIKTPCGMTEYADVGPALAAPAILAIHGAGGGFDQSLDLAWDCVLPYRTFHWGGGDRLSLFVRQCPGTGLARWHPRYL